MTDKGPLRVTMDIPKGAPPHAAQDIEAGLAGALAGAVALTPDHPRPIRAPRQVPRPSHFREAPGVQGEPRSPCSGRA